jgi:hypothetical protein
LCAACATLIDKDPASYPAPVLRRLKAEAEAKAAEEIEAAPATTMLELPFALPAPQTSPVGRDIVEISLRAADLALGAGVGLDAVEAAVERALPFALALLEDGATLELGVDLLRARAKLTRELGAPRLAARRYAVLERLSNDVRNEDLRRRILLGRAIALTSAGHTQEAWSLVRSLNIEGTTHETRARTDIIQARVLWTDGHIEAAISVLSDRTIQVVGERSPALAASVLSRRALLAVLAENQFCRSAEKDLAWAESLLRADDGDRVLQQIHYYEARVKAALVENDNSEAEAMARVVTDLATLRGGAPRSVGRVRDWLVAAA